MTRHSAIIAPGTGNDKPDKFPIPIHRHARRHLFERNIARHLDFALVGDASWSRAAAPSKKSAGSNVPFLKLRIFPRCSQINDRPEPSCAFVIVVGDWSCFSASNSKRNAGKAPKQGVTPSPIKKSKHRENHFFIIVV